MYKIVRVRRFDVKELNRVASILYTCGKDMAEKHDLHHWDNPYIKSLAIVCLCAWKNDIFLLYNNDKTTASFMVKLQSDALHFEKLAVLPSESGKGVGSFCLKKIEEMARNKGCERITLEVYQLSQHAISFYKNNGYRNVGTTETMKYKEVKMEKRI